VHFDHVNAHPLCRAIILFGLWYFTTTTLIMYNTLKCMKQIWSTMGWIKCRYTHLCCTCHISSK